MYIRSSKLLFSLSAIFAVNYAGAVTYGNTSPFETQSGHSQDFVLGVRVVVPQAITAQSFGMIYGIPGSSPATSNAIFGLYSSSATSGLPLSLVAVTNQINLNSIATYDNIAFTSPANISAGTYWMMALYESFASPRMGLTDPGSLVAYWTNPFANGMPTNAPGITTYTGQNFNYWINGTAVPEPASMAILVGALGAFAARRRNRKG